MAAWLAERGLTVDPSTLDDWVHAVTPRVIDAARRHRHPHGRTWRVDETCFTIGGRWRSAFRASDADGQLVDVRLSEHRDAASAKAFVEQASTSTDVAPSRVTTDTAKCYPPACAFQHYFASFFSVISRSWNRAAWPRRYVGGPLARRKRNAR